MGWDGAIGAVIQISKLENGEVLLAALWLCLFVIVAARNMNFSYSSIFTYQFYGRVKVGLCEFHLILEWGVRFSLLWREVEVLFSLV